MAALVLFASLVMVSSEGSDMGDLESMGMGGPGMGDMGSMGMGGPGMGDMGGMMNPMGPGTGGPAAAKAVESDVKYIQCATCKALVKRAVFRVDEARSAARAILSRVPSRSLSRCERPAGS